MIENQQVTLARKIFLKFTAQCQVFIIFSKHKNTDNVMFYFIVPTIFAFESTLFLGQKAQQKIGTISGRNIYASETP